MHPLVSDGSDMPRSRNSLPEPTPTLAVGGANHERTHLILLWLHQVGLEGSCTRRRIEHREHGPVKRSARNRVEAARSGDGAQQTASAAWADASSELRYGKRTVQRCVDTEEEEEEESCVGRFM
eukprot:504096-Prymnesium_polylepis.1